MPMSLRLAPVRESAGIPGLLGGEMDGPGGKGERRERPEGLSVGRKCLQSLAPSKQMGNLHGPPRSVRLLLLAAYGGSGGIQGQSGLHTVSKPEAMCIRDHSLPCSSPRLT